MPGDTGHQQDRRPRVPVARWAAPVRIDLDPEHQWLCWSGSARPTLVHAPYVGEELLECFVQLAHASADEIVGVARRWGLPGRPDLGNYPDPPPRAPAGAPGVGRPTPPHGPPAPP